MVQHVPVPFADTPLTSNVRAAAERDWSTNLNGPAVRLYGGEESAAFRVGDAVIRIGPAWRQLAELEWCHAVATAAAASVREAIAPRVSARGETVGLVDGRPVSVWPFIEGQWAGDDDEQQCSQAPVLLAAIHRALEGATVGPRSSRVIRTISRSTATSTPGNLLVRDRQVVAVLDWDEAFVGPPERWSSHGPHGSGAMAGWH